MGRAKPLAVLELRSAQQRGEGPVPACLRTITSSPLDFTHRIRSSTADHLQLRFTSHLDLRQLERLLELITRRSLRPPSSSASPQDQEYSKRWKRVFYLCSTSFCSLNARLPVSHLSPFVSASAGRFSSFTVFLTPSSVVSSTSE